MRRAGTNPKIVLVAILTIALAGCVLSGKPKTVATPPAVPQPAASAAPTEPLSIPQTDVKLPAVQAVPDEALATATPHEEPAPPAPAKPAPPPNNRTPVRPAGPAKPADTQPAATAPEPEQPPRAPIQEILSPDEQKSYKDRAHKAVMDTRSVLQVAKPRTPNQKRQEQEIINFLKQSDQADTAGDLRLAAQLAERAYTLAKELQSGK